MMDPQRKTKQVKVIYFMSCGGESKKLVNRNHLKKKKKSVMNLSLFYAHPK